MIRDSLWFDSPSFLRSIFLSVEIILAGFLWFRVRSWQRLANIPGPRVASFSILWLLKHAISGSLNDTLVEVDNKYGVIDKLVVPR